MARHATYARLFCLPATALLLLASSQNAWSQSSVRTRTFSFGKPVIALKGEIVAASGGATLSAGAGGTLALSITNTGQATARNAVLVLVPAATLKDIAVARIDTLDDIKPGETRTEKIPVGFPDAAPAQKGALTLSLSADPGAITATAKVDVAVRDVPYPKFTLRLIGPKQGVIAGESARIRLRVTNAGTGEGRGVSAIVSPDTGATDSAHGGVRALRKTVKTDVGVLRAGAYQEIPLDIRPPANAAGSASLLVSISEERRKFAFADTLSLQILPASAGVEGQAFDSFRRGDYRRAAGLFEKIAATGKGSKEVYFALGASLFTLREQKRSLAAMQKASLLGSADARGWLASHTTTVERVSVTYTKHASDPFGGYKPPIGIGILPFTDLQMQETPLTDEIYAALKKKNKKFRIFPNSTILSEQTALGLTSVAPSSKEILAGLERDFSMNFAVGGSNADTASAVFTLQILRCSDGETVASQEFRNSETSTALNDAVHFLLDGRVPKYTRSRNVELNAQ
ncbi:MAG TPA: hypothetical protein VMM80_05150 [Bacteroidota bacterium]|nr:hypothetical protein [Bacteroidota bacterium]